MPVPFNDNENYSTYGVTCA